MPSYINLKIRTFSGEQGSADLSAGQGAALYHFAAHIYDDRHLLYSFDFTDPEVYEKYLQSVFDTRDMSANIDKEMTVINEDQIITLVTCVGSQPNNRLLVQAVLTEREPGTEADTAE